MRARARLAAGPGWARASVEVTARRVLPWIGLGLLTACGRSCGDAPPPGLADGSSTGAIVEPTSSGSTGPSCPPEPGDTGGYDPCPPECAGGGQCLFDGVDRAVCTRGCFSDCDCWPAPSTGATARCSTEILEGAGVCVLECTTSGMCPAPMTCVSTLGICAHPYEPPPGTSGDSGDSGDSTGSGPGGTTGGDEIGGTR